MAHSLVYDRREVESIAVRHALSHDFSPAVFVTLRAINARRSHAAAMEISPPSPAAISLRDLLKGGANMKRTHACVLFFAALAAGVSGSAAATSFGADHSDLWWNAQVNGEGFNVIQQGDTLFMTLFVYDGSNKPIWYVGSNVAYVPAASNFQGELYITQGPPGVSPLASPVGTVTFAPTSPTSATFTYTVNGVPFTKTLTRQTWRNGDISGSYIGAKIGTYSGPACSTNGYLEERSVSLVTQSGQAVTMQTTYSNYSCITTGTYTQAGRMGSIDGNFSCSNGHSGRYTATEVEVTPQGLSGRYASSRPGCDMAGHFGGVRRLR